MGQESLVNEQIDAGEDFARDFSNYFSIAAAFWLIPADSEEWFLYIASAEIHDDNVDVAYSEVLRIVCFEYQPTICFLNNPFEWLT